MTNRTKITTGAILVACCVFGALKEVLPVAAQVQRTMIGKDSDGNFAFDHTGNDAMDAPIAMDSVEFIFAQNDPPTLPTEPIRVTMLMTPVAIGTNSFPARDVLTTIPAGEFDVTARVRAIGGNWSEESEIFPVEITAKKPSRPFNLGFSN